MDTFNIFLTGVGGQGIGMLSELVLRAADHAGFDVKAVDTHGLAQRGGIVVSQVRIGPNAYTPLIEPGDADLVIALEANEALRGLQMAAGEGSVLIYYDTSWQPLAVRLNQAPEVSEGDIAGACARDGVRLYRVLVPDLVEARMQNIAVLAAIDRHALIPEVAAEHYRQAMGDLMAEPLLERNLELFDRLRTKPL